MMIWLLLLFTVQGQPAALPIVTANVVSTAPSQNYHTDVGTCTCDVTVGRCDYNCCCDSDCTDVLTLFPNVCSTTAINMNIPYCSNYLYFANWQSATGTSTYRATGGALCVVVANSAVQGNYYTFTGTYLTDATFSLAYAIGSSIYSLSAYTLDQTYLPTTAYKVSDYIAVSYTLSSLVGLLSLPSPGTSGECTLTGYVKFMNNAQWSCRHTIAVAATECAAGTSLDVNHYLSNMQLIGSPLTNTAVVGSVTAGVITCVGATGTTSVCAVVAPTFVVVSGICSNYVTKITYRFTYTVTAGAVSLTALAVDADLSTGVITASTSINQVFATAFTESTVVAAVTKRAGNPGYLQNNALMFGSKVVTGGITYIPDAQFGVTLVKETVNAGAISCPGSFAAPVVNYLDRAPIMFPQNLVTGCTIPITKTQLAVNCAAIRTYVYSLQTLTVVANAITHVAMFGNASVQNEYEWVKIVNTVPVAANDAVTGIDATGKCNSILTDFDVEILYEYVGVQSNPQPAIVGVKFNYVLGSFQYRCLASGNCVTLAASTSTAQSFRIRSSVTFVAVSSPASAYSPPIPKPVPYIPDDIWYPFYL